MTNTGTDQTPAWVLEAVSALQAASRLLRASMPSEQELAKGFATAAQRMNEEMPSSKELARGFAKAGGFTGN